MRKIFNLFSITLIYLILLFNGCLRKPENPVAVSNNMYPTAPQNLEATFGDRFVILKWQIQNPNNIAKYYIFRADSINPEFQLIDSSTIQTYTDSYLDNELEYFYQISAKNLQGYFGPRSKTIRTIPGFYNVIINNGERYTDSLSVNLTFIAPSTVSLIMISNDSLFENSTWEPFIEHRRWRLTGGDGIKTIYVKFRDDLGNETAKMVSDNIILDTKAFISLVTEDTEGLVKTLGDTIHFTIVTHETNGFASINIGEVMQGITLYDDGTNGDRVANDGIYEVDYVINQYFTATNSLIIGNFTDPAGNIAFPVAASGKVTIQQFPTPVTLFDPIIEDITINLYWTQNNDEEFSSYRIYRSETQNFNDNLFPIAVIDDRTTNFYQDKGLQYSTTYYYCVYVLDFSGQSVASNKVMAVTSANKPPEKVILAIPSLINNSTLRLSWTQNTDTDFSSYRIFRSESSPVDTTATPIMIINTQTTTLFDDLNLVMNKKYYYRIFVYDTGGLCTGSDEVSGSTSP